MTITWYQAINNDYNNKILRDVLKNTLVVREQLKKKPYFITDGERKQLERAGAEQAYGPIDY
jgi:hypothetical protein